MKVSTFDSDKIRIYMEGSSVLQKGIEYCKAVNPGVSDEVAKATAIQLAQQYCQQKWYNDRSGYISNEYMAFSEFEKDVNAGRYFSAPYSSSSGSKSKKPSGCLKGVLIFIAIYIALHIIATIYMSVKFGG